MITATIIIILPVLISTTLMAGILRRLVRDKVDVERQLRAPDADMTSYALPKGVDPGQFRGLV